jgi:hypothetical protein
VIAGRENVEIETAWRSEGDLNSRDPSAFDRRGFGPSSKGRGALTTESVVGGILVAAVQARTRSNKVKLITGLKQWPPQLKRSVPNHMPVRLQLVFLEAPAEQPSSAKIVIVHRNRAQALLIAATAP